MAQGGGQDRLAHSALAVEATRHRSPDEPHARRSPAPALSGRRGRRGGAGSRRGAGGRRGGGRSSQARVRSRGGSSSTARRPRRAGVERGGHLLDGLVDATRRRPARRAGISAAAGQEEAATGPRRSPRPPSTRNRRSARRPAAPHARPAGQLDVHDVVGGQEVGADQQDRHLGAPEARLDLVVPPPGHADPAIRPEVHASVRGRAASAPPRAARACRRPRGHS